MGHPHPGYVPPPEQPERADGFATREPRDAHRWLYAGIIVAVLVLCAVALTWSSLTAHHDASRSAAAAQRACGQVQRLGQKCATNPADPSPGGQAIVPAAPTTLTPLTASPFSHDPSVAAPGPEQSASGAQEGVNPGSDVIVGLTVRGQRLEITYSDGNVVDAGQIVGAPPPIVLIVASASPSPSPSDSASPSPSPSATDSAPADDDYEPADPTGTPSEEPSS